MAHITDQYDSYYFPIRPIRHIGPISFTRHQATPPHLRGMTSGFQESFSSNQVMEGCVLSATCEHTKKFPLLSQRELRIILSKVITYFTVLFLPII